MKKENKIVLKTFLISGSFFAIWMAGYEYIVDHEFEIWKFLFHFITFGLAMGFLARKNYRKNLIDEKSKNE